MHDYNSLAQELLDSLNERQKQILYELLQHDWAMERIMDFHPSAAFMTDWLKAHGYERFSVKSMDNRTRQKHFYSTDLSDS